MPELPVRDDDGTLDDDGLEALARAYATPPPPTLRHRLVAAARADVATRGRVLRWRRVGAVAAVLAVALGLAAAHEWQRAEHLTSDVADMVRANAQLAGRIDDQDATLAALRAAVDGQATVLRVLAGPRTRVAPLAPAAGRTGAGRVLVDVESGQAAVVLAGLPPLPAGRTYELWAIRGSQPPEPAALLDLRTEGPTATEGGRFAQPEEVTAFAVSIEPAGGSQRPTGPIVLSGPVAG